MPVVFQHPKLPTLTIRLNPTSVKYTYNLVTSIENTYGGQVVQFLGINYGQLIIEGRFGKEGPHGRKSLGGGRGTQKDSSEMYKDTSGIYGVGLSQMYEWFVQYFHTATQGGDGITGHYDQHPVTVTYGGAGKPSTWKVFPVSFPSFKRSNEDFAPEWRVVCEVEEPARDHASGDMASEINKLRENTGTVEDKYSFPPGDPLEFDDKLDEVITQFRKILPRFTEKELDELIFFGASLPFRVGEGSGGDAEISPDAAGGETDPALEGASPAPGSDVTIDIPSRPPLGPGVGTGPGPR